MFDRFRFVLVLPLLMLIAADQPVKVMRIVSSKAGRLGVTALDSSEFQRYRMAVDKFFPPELAGLLMKVTFSDSSSTAMIMEYELYDGADDELRAGHIFESAEPAPPASKAAMRLKLKRLLEPVEVLVPTGADSQYMIDRVKKLKPGDLVMARYKGNDKRLTDLSHVGEVVQGFYKGTAQVTVGTRKVAGIEVEVNGEYKSYALPPAGRKTHPGDSEVLAVCKKLKKGVPIRMTLDSDQPEVVNHVEINVEVYQIDEESYRVLAPGMSATFRIDDGRVSGTISGNAVTDADYALVRGLKKLRLEGDSRIVKFPEQASLRQLIMEFSEFNHRNRDSNNEFSKQLRTRLPHNAEPRQTAMLTIELLLEAAPRLRTESMASFKDARTLLGPERTALIEEKGRQRSDSKAE